MAVTINFYDKFAEFFGDNTIDLDADQFFIALMTSSHVFTSTNTILANVTANEIAAGNGYTQAVGGLVGEELTSVVWLETAGVLKFDAVDPQWTASGGDIGPANDAVIFDDTATAAVDALVCSIDFDGAQTAGNGTDFDIIFDAAGIFTITVT